MRVVIQRVGQASVTIDACLYSSIKQGLLILVGIERGDTDLDLDYVARKTAALRIFNDDAGIMNRSVIDIAGQILAVSQFTLTASTARGNRPSYIRAAGHELAVPLYEKFCNKLSQLTGTEVKRGVFGADMLVSLDNDGPVTIIIDSRWKE